MGAGGPGALHAGRDPAGGDGPGMHGTEFNDHFTDAMIANRTAEIALCRTELTDGASPQARAPARTMLTERQAELTQLQAWHSQSQHGMMSG